MLRSMRSRQPLCRAGAAPDAPQRPCISLRRRSASAAALPSSTEAAPATAPPRSASGLPDGASEMLAYVLPRQTAALFAAAAVLGPLCDGLHSSNGVLHYSAPSIQLQLQLPGLAAPWSLESCWWVPLLFGVAGVILGVGVPLLDLAAAAAGGRRLGDEPAADAGEPGRAGAAPSWPAVLACISLFVSQYWLSGVLEQPLLGVGGPVPALDAALCAYALAHSAAFDRTPQGLAMAALTAAAGPLVEMGLISWGGLYHYTHPNPLLAVPTWIPWVYWCGGPAVGNLGRRCWSELEGQWLLRQQQQQQRAAAGLPEP